MRPHVLLIIVTAIMIRVFFSAFAFSTVSILHRAFQSAVIVGYLPCSASVRLYSIAAGGIFGHGSLSLIWQEGFHRVIGEHFFGRQNYRYVLPLWPIRHLLVLGLDGHSLTIAKMPAGSRRRSYFAILLFLIVLLPVAPRSSIEDLCWCSSCDDDFLQISIQAEQNSRAGASTLITDVFLVLIK